MQTKLTLTVRDMAALESLLPQKSGSTAEMLLARGLLERASIYAPEVQAAGKREEDGRVVWPADFTREIDFSDAEMDVLRSGVERLKKSEGITLANLDLVLKVTNATTTTKEADG